MIGIYIITNKLNGKIYIGQSINIEERWKQHIYKAFNENEIGYNSAIHQAFRKYGVENFDFSVLEECDQEELDDKEIQWIKDKNSMSPNGYNILAGGQKIRANLEKRKCPICGEIMSKGASQCLKCYLKERRKNIPSKQELLEQLDKNNGNFSAVGRFYNVTDNAVRDWCKKYNISCSSKDYKKQIKKEPCKKRVRQIDINTNQVIAEFESIIAAAKSLGKNKSSHIVEVCKGKLKQAYGYKWEYIN